MTTTTAQVCNIFGSINLVQLFNDLRFDRTTMALMSLKDGQFSTEKRKRSKKSLDNLHEV